MSAPPPEAFSGRLSAATRGALTAAPPAAPSSRGGRGPAPLRRLGSARLGSARPCPASRPAAAPNRRRGAAGADLRRLGAARPGDERRLPREVRRGRARRGLPGCVRRGRPPATGGRGRTGPGVGLGLGGRGRGRARWGRRCPPLRARSHPACLFRAAGRDGVHLLQVHEREPEGSAGVHAHELAAAGNAQAALPSEGTARSWAGGARRWADPWSPAEAPHCKAV